MSRHLKDIEIAVVLRRSTLPFIEEHSEHQVGGSIDLNEGEVIALFKGDTMAKLLSVAEAGETRLDDILRRVCLGTSKPAPQGPAGEPPGVMVGSHEFQAQHDQILADVREQVRERGPKETTDFLNDLVKLAGQAEPKLDPQQAGWVIHLAWLKLSEIVMGLAEESDP